MRIVYVMDPLCGWCWGNAAGICAAWEELRARVTFDLLPGGMWAGPGARRQSPRLARVIRDHDAQVARVAHAPFGDAYFTSLDREGLLLDSEPPSRAIVVVRTGWPDLLFPFARSVQAARFEGGRDLNEPPTYDPICVSLGIDPAAFGSAWHSDRARRDTQAAFGEAARYAAAYPTLILLRDGTATLLAEGFVPPPELGARIEAAIA